MEFEIRLSGLVEVRTAGHSGDLGPTKTRLTLAALAWDAERTVDVDTLIHRVWDDRPPLKPRESLHSHVSRIRSGLQSAGAGTPVVVRGTNSYVLRVPPDRVDLRLHADLTGRGRSLRESDPEEALRLLDRADGLWRGEPLAGIAGSWPEHLRTTVAGTVLEAATARADALLGMGRFTEAVPVLLPLVEERALDEALAERLVIALYGSGRTAEATGLLQRTRQRIVRDVGLDMGRRLHRAHQGIITGTPAGDLLRRTDDRREAAPERPASTAPDNLPRDIPWVGRRDELYRLGSTLGEGAGETVVTVEAIHGMGGVGKTSLAVHLAHRLKDRFPDGRLFVHLGGPTVGRPPARVLAELLRLLGMRAEELPREADELTALWRSSARNRRMLVVLDDAVDSEQIRPLLPGASPTAVIVTSRRRLPGLPGVRAFSLDVLPDDDAIELFNRRLGARPGTAEAATADIVRICCHVPLAIEIAASRLLARPSWTVSDLLGQLEGEGALAALQDGERTMTHVFDLSYRALSVGQQLVFRRIGLHDGVEFGPSAVAALTGLSFRTAETVLEELMAHHLVSEPSPHRFTMHDLLREYARSLAEPDGTDPADAVRNLVTHYIGAADRASAMAYPFRSRTEFDVPRHLVPSLPELAGAGPAEQWLITESGNLLNALNWFASNGTEHELAVAVRALACFLDAEGHLATTEPLFRKAVRHWEVRGEDVEWAQALLDLSTVHTQGAHYPEGITEAGKALEVARSVGDPELEFQSAHQLSILFWQAGRYEEARSLQEDLLGLPTATEDKLKAARSHNMLGIINLHLAEYQDALFCFTQSLAEFAEIGDARGQYVAINNLAKFHQKIGDKKSAELYLRQAIAEMPGVGTKRDQVTVHMNLADVLEAQGRVDEALSLYAAVLPVLRELGDLRGETIALNGMGRAHLAVGRGEEALGWHTSALTVARRIDAAGEEADVLHDLAMAECEAGSVERAVAHLEESLAISRRIGARAEEARAVCALTRMRGLSESL
ncbi:AfsR/SARP family transcriptional regulator [Streptomyces nitrosporeus]|uniref:AfsR/SARP family transcriptional regulator n=1 Tax=Streptomyces nitrosporeus TaxID=28894 RepID=UPI00331DC5F2